MKSSRHLIFQLLEMAAIGDENSYYQETPLYHGTSKDEAGRSILAAEVVRPGNLGKTSIRKMYQPMGGRVYVTPSVREAVINAIGGIYMGDDYVRPNTTGCWIFQLDPSSFKDAVVDEDNLGQIAHDLLTNRVGDITAKLSEPVRNTLQRIISWALSPQQKQRCKDYSDFGHLTVAGKKLAMAIEAHHPALMHRLAKETGSNLAMQGELKVRHAWRLDPSRIKDLDKDGSNFFHLADQLK
jgi:hypothetical protein